MTSKQFCIRLICGVLLALALIGLFNRIVDPFWYYRDTEISDFNAIKTKFGGFERIVKPALLIRNQPEAIILGSSFSEIGLNPTNPFFTNHGQLRSMNFALARASWEEVQCDFEFAVKHAQIKRVLVGFHPGNLPATNCEKDFSTIGQISMKELLLSQAALSASITTIRRQRAEDISHTREGMFFYNRGDSAEEVAKRFRRDLPKGDQLITCLNSIHHKAAENLDVKKVFDLSGLEHMTETAKTHGVELVLFAYPRHVYSLELESRCLEQDIRWQAMKQIANVINAKSAEGAKVRAWQFYAYNGITGEPVSSTSIYWQDPGHFNFEMGDLMMSDMFGTRDKPIYGKAFTSKQIETDYQGFLQARNEYLQRHPEFKAEIQKLLNAK